MEHTKNIICVLHHQRSRVYVIAEKWEIDIKELETILFQTEG